MKKEIPKIIDLTYDLRESINSSITFSQQAWKNKNDGNWDKLCSGLDNLEDAQIAIDDYSFEGKFRLIEIYGLLQAFIVQHDALRHIEEAIDMELPNIKDDYPELEELRNLRNETIGHPSETKVKRSQSKYGDGSITFSTISRGSSKEILDYGVWSSNGFEHKTIRIKDVIKKQEDLMRKEIDRVMKKINQREMEHKSKFKGTNLYDIFSQSGYYIQKLWSFEKSRAYSKICLDLLEKSYEKFKKEIISRYKLKTITEYGLKLPGLVDSVQHIEEILSRLKTKIDLSEETDPVDLDVYVLALRYYIDECSSMAKEIDREFNS